MRSSIVALENGQGRPFNAPDYGHSDTLLDSLELLHLHLLTLASSYTEQNLNDHNENLDEVDPDSQCQITDPKYGSFTSAKRTVYKFEGKMSTEVILSYFEPAGKAIFMEAVFCPCSTVTDSTCILYTWQQALRSNRCGVI